MTLFKPGDKVTSPLLVGEWTVTDVRCEDNRVRLMRDGGTAYLLPADLALVAPPAPPEPLVGTVGFVDGEPWLGSRDFGWYCLVRNRGSLTWDGIADRFVPAVPQPTVEEMADALTDAPYDLGRARRVMRALGWEVES